MAPSRPLVWCPAQLYPKNMWDVQNPSSAGERGREEGAGWRLQSGHECAEQHRGVSPTSPCHTELRHTLVLSITSNPTEIMDSRWERKSPRFDHLDLTQLRRKPKFQARPSPIRQGCASPAAWEVVQTQKKHPKYFRRQKV